MAEYCVANAEVRVRTPASAPFLGSEVQIAERWLVTPKAAGATPVTPAICSTWLIRKIYLDGSPDYYYEIAAPAIDSDAIPGKCR